MRPVLFSRQIIINFIRCALSRGGACARVFSRTTCSLARFQILSNNDGEYVGETKRFLLHFATRYRGWKLRPTKHFVLQCFHRPSAVVFSFSLTFSLSRSLSLPLFLLVMTSPRVHIFPLDFYDTFRDAFIRVPTNNFSPLLPLIPVFEARVIVVIARCN